MKAFLFSILAFSMIIGCAPRLAAPAPLPAVSAKSALAERVEADRKADTAIKSSADARAAEAKAREELRALEALMAEKKQEVTRWKAEAEDLRRQEIADRIRVVSWALILAGFISAVVMAFLAIRFDSRTAWVAAACAGGSVGLGVFGLWFAPHWIAGAWVVGIGLVCAAIGMLVHLLHRSENAGAVAAANWKTYAESLPAHIRESLDQMSRNEQPDNVRGTINRWLSR